MREQIEEKKKLIEILRDMPFLTGACSRAGIPRSTAYRWINNDKEFAKRVRKAIKRGDEMVNDMAYGKLVQKIKEGNLPAIIYHLSRRHPNYKKRNMGLKVKVEHKQEPLPPALLDKAIEKVSVGDLPKQLRKKVVRKAMKENEALGAFFQAVSKEMGGDIPKNSLTPEHLATALRVILEEGSYQEQKKNTKRYKRERKHYWRQHINDIEPIDRHLDWESRKQFDRD